MLCAPGQNQAAVRCVSGALRRSRSLRPPDLVFARCCLHGVVHGRSEGYSKWRSRGVCVVRFASRAGVSERVAQIWRFAQESPASYQRPVASRGTISWSIPNWLRSPDAAASQVACGLCCCPASESEPRARWERNRLSRRLPRPTFPQVLLRCAQPSTHPVRSGRS